MSPKARTRVIGYVRVSTDEQADKRLSLDAQRAKIRQYCDLYELELVELVEDAATAKTLDRPGLQRALGMLEAVEAAALLVVKLDRLTRSVRDLGDLVELAKRDDWALMSVGEHLDTTTAAGRMVINILGVISQWEREAIAERTSTALQHLRAEGIQLGRAPYGFRHTEAGRVDSAGRRILEPVPFEQAVLARIKELRDEGLTQAAIAGRLNEEKCPSRGGGRWHVTQVARVLARLELA